jgi:hypothetical protein
LLFLVRPFCLASEETPLNQHQAEELVYQALETEQGGVRVYRLALQCAVHPTLKLEWREYLRHTENHERVLRDLCEKLGLDQNKETPGRLILRGRINAMVTAMEAAIAEGDEMLAQLVAAECIVDAETKDHQNWNLIREVANKVAGSEGKALRSAFDQVEEEEDEHLYHTMGWTRELWLQSLGLPVEFPPAEDKKDVKTAIGAARARQARKPKNGGMTIADEIWRQPIAS